MHHMLHGLDLPLEHLPGLKFEIPPTVSHHLSQIEPWVTNHLKSTIQSDVHYEHQLYGPLNTFLTSIFPISRRFMIIPQGLLRKVVESDAYLDEDDHIGDVSIGSTGGLHESRNLPGSEVGKLYPDFLIVKVEPQSMDKPRQYVIVDIVEVKREDETAISAFKQVAKYLQRAYSHPLHDQNLCAHLVISENVHQARMGEGEVVFDYPYSMFAAGDEFTKRLCDTAIRNWN